MKKIYTFIFSIIMIMEQSIYTCHAFEMNDTAKIDIEYSSPYLNERDIYSGYTTTNKNEITIITHFLESLKKTEGGGVPTDSKHLYITLSDNSDIIKNYAIYPSILQIFKDENSNNKYGYGVYKFPIAEYYRMCDFINGLILNKFDKNSTVSAELSDWAKEHIDEAIIDGLIPKWNQIGYANNISRVEVCQLIDNLFTVKGIEKKTPNDYTYLNDYPFVDTRDISVKELYLQGIIDGKSDTEFCPWDNITREEFAKILVNTYNVISVDDESDNKEIIYLDKGDVSDWALESVKTVTALGLMQGDENGCFNPKENTTKEQVIVTLLRLYKI